MDEFLKREIILDNYQNPKHKTTPDTKDYIHVNMNSKSCIDEVNVYLKVKDNIIEDASFDGEACAICTSSSSIMCDLLIGKTLDDALNIINNFNNMIDEKEYDKDILGEALVYDTIYKQPNRIKCATLAWDGALKALDGDTDGK